MIWEKKARDSCLDPAISPSTVRANRTLGAKQKLQRASIEGLEIALVAFSRMAKQKLLPFVSTL